MTVFNEDDWVRVVCYSMTYQANGVYVGKLRFYRKLRNVDGKSLCTVVLGPYFYKIPDGKEILSRKESLVLCAFVEDVTKLSDDEIVYYSLNQ